MAMLMHGEKIIWEHWITLRGKTWRQIDRGIYLGMIKHTKRYWLKPGRVQMVRIRFEGRGVLRNVPQSQVLKDDYS